MVTQACSVFTSRETVKFVLSHPALTLPWFTAFPVDVGKRPRTQIRISWLCTACFFALLRTLFCRDTLTCSACVPTGSRATTRRDDYRRPRPSSWAWQQSRGRAPFRNSASHNSNNHHHHHHNNNNNTCCNLVVVNASSSGSTRRLSTPQRGAQRVWAGGVVAARTDAPGTHFAGLATSAALLGLRWMGGTHPRNRTQSSCCRLRGTVRCSGSTVLELSTHT